MNGTQGLLDLLLNVIIDNHVADFPEELCE